jgi:hypothetical protein
LRNRSHTSTKSDELVLKERLLFYVKSKAGVVFLGQHLLAERLLRRTMVVKGAGMIMQMHATVYVRAPAFRRSSGLVDADQLSAAISAADNLVA